MQLTKYNKNQILSIERQTAFGKKWLKMKSNEAERNRKKTNLGYAKDKRLSPTHLDRLKMFATRRG